MSESSDRDIVEEVGEAVPPLAMDRGMWLNMFNVKPPYLVDLEIESVKKYFGV